MATGPISESSAPPPAPTDPYVTTRANLRDTIKWLAATFSALAAVVVAGSPLSGLGKLPFGLQWFAAAAVLVAAFSCICVALATTISLLRGDFVYLSDILGTAAANEAVASSLAGWLTNPRKRLKHALFRGKDLADLDAADRQLMPMLRDNLKAHPGEILPFDYPTVEDFKVEIDKQKNEFDEARTRWKAQLTPDTAKAYREARTKWESLLSTQQKVLFFASTFLLYARFRRAMGKLFLLGGAALVLLVIFGNLTTETEKESKSASSITNNFPSPPTLPPPLPPVAQALPSLQPVLFATGKASLDDENLKRVDAARAALRANPRASLLLFAHTDTIAGDQVNEELAHQRGTAVRRALIREGGLDAARILVSEQPKSGLPQLTGTQTESPTNRSVVMQLVNLP